MKRACYFIFIMTFLSMVAFSQKPVKKDYFIVSAGDTTFCTALKYEEANNGDLDMLKYTDLQGKKVAYEGKKNVPDVVTIFRLGKAYDRVPIDLDKPDKYTRFAERMEEGKVVLYRYFKEFHDPKDPTRAISVFAFTYVKLPDGTLCNAEKKKVMNSQIKPVLLECSAFASGYGGDYGTKIQDIRKMVKLYNWLCK